jgi:light-regulated signal transduction histidine kinase (bacteriophytochrome)
MDGFSRALLEDYAGKLDDEGQDNLQRIRAASQRMGQLIDDLLNLSRVSRDELRRGPVDLTGIAVKIAAELSRQYPDKCFDFRIQENMTCTGDARLIQLMLENLLGNACKFSSKKPDPCIEFGTTNREEHRAFFVRDNGAGFDMALSHKLFGPFQRLHSAAEFPGTGIGLATVQRIIQRHGGQITAESAIDRGTTFYFTLPEQPLSTS